MSSVILLLLCLLLGVIFKRTKIFPKETAQVLNQFIIFISLPAMALFYLPKIELTEALLYPVGVAWIGFLFSFVLFGILGIWLGWSKSLTGCMILLGGLGNTSFLGIPIIEELYGKDGLETLVIVDLPGSFVALSTIGVAVAAGFSRGKTNSKEIIKRMVSFPPLIAFVVGFIIILLNWNFPPVMDEVFEKLAATVSPLALVSVGFQLKVKRRSKHWAFLVLALLFQLFLWPLVILLFYKGILDQEGLPIDVCVMEAGMAPMITAAIVASNYGLKPNLSNMIVGVGIPVSYVTLAFWYWILSML